MRQRATALAVLSDLKLGSRLIVGDGGGKWSETIVLWPIGMRDGGFTSWVCYHPGGLFKAESASQWAEVKAMKRGRSLPGASGMVTVFEDAIEDQEMLTLISSGRTAAENTALCQCDERAVYQGIAVDWENDSLGEAPAGIVS